MPEEIIINMKNEIEKYALHSIDEEVGNSNNPVKSKGIKTYVDNIKDTIISTIKTYIEQNYSNTTTIEQTYLTQEDAEDIYLTQENAEDTYLTQENATTNYAPYEHEHDFSTNMYANPTLTTKNIDHLINPGYYQYVGSDALFVCGPDNVHYTNGYIKVEQQSNQIIQHVYATSYSTASQSYKIDGREYMRHVWLSEEADVITHNVGNWYAKHIPWQERSDLLINKGSTNVDDQSFTIFECTAGYVFQWIQNGPDHDFILPVNANEYTLIYNFKSLPIAQPYLMSNLIGHVDIKITDSEFKIRSTNKKNEKITGVNGVYFVPRIN